MNISITRPTKVDFEELHSLFTVTIESTFRREGIDKTHADEIPEEVQFQVDTLRRDFASGGRDEHYFIARTDSRIVGTAAIGTTTGGVMRALGLNRPSIPELKSVYIVPECQGRRIGSRLVNACIALLAGRGEPEFSFECGYKHSQLIWIRKFGQPAIVVPDKFGAGASLMFWRCRTTTLLGA